MRFEQSQHKAAQSFEHRRKLIQRADRRYEREAFAYWSSDVQRQAETAGVTPPTSTDLTLLKRLAEIDGPFSASQAVRRGWCGIRSVEDATRALNRFVDNGWLHRALANREGQARYAFTREHGLGRDHLGDREWWPEWVEMHSCPDNRFTRGTGGKPGFNPLVAAGFIDGGSPDEFSEATGEEYEGQGFDYCEVPDPAAEGDLWAVSRALAWRKGTALHKIAGRIEGLSPIQCAYAMAIAQCRLAGDPVPTHIRGIAEYLGMDYNALRAGIAVAETAIRIMNEFKTGRNVGDNPATQTPTVEI